MTDVAGKTPGQIQRWWLGRAAALLRYHARQSLNFAYRELIQDAGVDPASPAWGRVPIIDKQWLAGACYERQPACPGPVLVVATSGSTASQVLVPVTAECANRGLGDNFLRALAMSGTGPGHRHWGIEHRPDGQGQGQTGSSISMTWLARHCGDNALVSAATEPLDDQLRRAAAFGPDTISGSPGFLKEIARAETALRPMLLVYGGAALADADACLLWLAFREPRLLPSIPRPMREPWGPRLPATAFTVRSPRRTLSRCSMTTAVPLPPVHAVMSSSPSSMPGQRRSSVTGWATARLTRGGNMAVSFFPISSVQPKPPSGQRSSPTATFGPGRPAWQHATRPSWRSSWYARTRPASSASSP